MNVRRIRIDDVAAFRRTRLLALRSDPDAFESTYEAERAQPAEKWDTWVALSAEGQDQAMFLAEEDDQVIGIAGAFRLEREPRTMHLIAMWVDPKQRRRGVGRRLTEAVVGWANGADADRVMLWVVGTNEPAQDLYAELGFEPTGASKPLPTNPDLVEYQMALPLGSSMRMPVGYVDLVPMTRDEVRAFVEWVIADRTARAMEHDNVPFAVASADVRSRIGATIDGPPGTSHHFSTLRAGADPDVCGWLWLSEHRREGTRIATIEDLVIFEDFRGRGLAASAVESAILQVEMGGIRTLEATIPANNAAARRIAEACGFVEVGRLPTDVVMRLDIEWSRQ